MEGSGFRFAFACDGDDGMATEDFGSGDCGVGHIAVIGNALPRKCCIATYTTDIRLALAARYPELRVDHWQ
jgi:hypothetical protein